MVGKILTLVGIVMIGFGIFGVVRASQSMFGINFGNTMQLATDTKAREAELCKPGEKLQEDKGPSEYDALQNLHKSSVTMYCVNNDGVKRDVTDQFATGMIGQVGGIVTNAFSGLIGGVIYFVLIGIGVVLMIIGLILGRGRRPAMTAVSFGVPNGSNVYSAPVPSSFNAQPGSTVNTNQGFHQPQTAKPSSGDVAARLQQLNDAHKAGLITDAEYNRTRQQILDTLK